MNLKGAGHFFSSPPIFNDIQNSLYISELDVIGWYGLKERLLRKSKKYLIIEVYKI